MLSSMPAHSSKPRSCAKLAVVELVSGTDLSRGRRMQHGHDERPESRSELASA
jgi:hypothetical protein